MQVKYLIKGIKGYFFDENNTLWRLPCKIGKRQYGLKEIKRQSDGRWKIRGVWKSEAQMELVKSKTVKNIEKL